MERKPVRSWSIQTGTASPMNRSTSTACLPRGTIANLPFFMYNTQMTSSRFSIALAIALLAGMSIPTVQAYVTPEEMLTEESYHNSAVDPESEDFDDKDWEISDNNYYE